MRLIAETKDDRSVKMTKNAANEMLEKIESGQIKASPIVIGYYKKAAVKGKKTVTKKKAMFNNSEIEFMLKHGLISERDLNLLMGK